MPDQEVRLKEDAPHALAAGGRLLLRGASAAILRALATGEKSVTELVRSTGLAQSNVSNHLARLRERGFVTSQRRGRQILYRLASAGLAHFLASAGDWQPRDEIQPESVAQEFLNALLTLQEELPAHVVDKALADGLTWREMYLQVFAPALNQVGEMWERGELTVAAEHLISAVAQRLLHRLSLSLPVAPDSDAPTALVGCVEGELHTVGGRMVADFLIAQGWRAWYLNGLLPLEHLMEAVQRQKPDAVVLCISTAERRASLEAAVQRLCAWRGDRPLPLLVAGGRFFDTEPSVAGLDLFGTDLESVTAGMSRQIEAVRGAGT